MDNFRKYELEDDPWSRYDFSFDKEEFNPENFSNGYENFKPSLLQVYYFEGPKLVDLLFGINGEGEYYYDNDLSEEKLKRLEERYASGAIEYDEYGEKQIIDPLENWSYDDSIVEDVIFEAGHLLGLMGNLGIYYRLLSDKKFASGYWQGCVEKVVSENKIEDLENIKEEIEMLRPGTSKKEMINISRNLYKTINKGFLERQKNR